MVEFLGAAFLVRSLLFFVGFLLWFREGTCELPVLASWSCASPGQVALAAACINPPGEHPSVSFPFILLLAPFCSLRTSALLDASRYQGWAPVSIRSAQAAPVSSAPAALVPSAGCEQTRDCSVHVVLVQEASLSSGADSLPSGCGQSAAAAHVGGLQWLDLARPRARPRRRRLDLRRWARASTPARAATGHTTHVPLPARRWPWAWWPLQFQGHDGN